ncbi:MAG: ATP-dependent 6-phosphofructokinase [Spirochaetales bacterium]|nr:ATP-dependent 6-phosphofructokinase [Spirochaetales bacterium]
MDLDFSIPRLGEAKIKSPIQMSTTYGDNIANYVTDDEHILYDIEARPGMSLPDVPRELMLEKAGPRESIFFSPAHVHAGIVTCGGLCPGLNNVIRAIVRTMWFRYGVRRITGIQNGYRGFLPEYHIPTRELTPEVVDSIHTRGGTILGTSRGNGAIADVCDAISRMNLNILFTIGGDGTQKGAFLIAEEMERRGQKLSVIGVPKTIDNDLSFVQKTFGFETAVSKAVEAVSSAHIEAHDAINGIGLVKVMGRESGFIAAHTTLAMNDVNFTLIPELDFDLEGSNGLFAHLKARLERRHHAVILVAEGAGQELMAREQELPDGTDKSGNKLLGDIGLYLKTRIKHYFDAIDMEVSIKYIDPSYMIRSAPANPNDAIYCARLGSHAVHAAMSGRTRTLISQYNNHLVHIPMKMAISKRNSVDPESSLWRDVLEETHQPVLMKNGL